MSVRFPRLLVWLRMILKKGLGKILEFDFIFLNNIQELILGNLDQSLSKNVLSKFFTGTYFFALSAAFRVVIYIPLTILLKESHITSRTLLPELFFPEAILQYQTCQISRAVRL